MLDLTPDVLAKAYDFLRETKPFKAWKLPHSDIVGFKVDRRPGEYGHYGRYRRTAIHWIAINSKTVGQTQTLLFTMAHEMIHLRQGIHKTETSNCAHNAEFLKLSKRICAVHGWDLKAFFGL
jgi:Zn-dependent peptidase ImmA (M78 family)